MIPMSWLVILLSSTMALQADVPVRLQYLPKVPVLQTSILEMDTNDVFPGLKLDGKASQTIKGVVTILGDDTLPISGPPLDFTFTLKNVDVGFSANGVHVGFSSKDPLASIFLAQSLKLIDKPLHIHVDGDLKIGGEGSELQKLLQDIPALEQLNLTHFFAEWFQELFSLSAKDLKVGDTYETTKILDKNEERQGTSFSYTVTAITPEEIEAEIKGEMEPQILSLTSQFSGDGGKVQAVELSLMGKILGNVAWNRQNALLYRLNTHYDYTGGLKIGDTTHALHLQLKHQLDSVPAP